VSTGIEVNKKTRFLAWVKASVRGDLVTCEFRCAEFRPLGQASASESHFRYGEHQHEKYKTTEDGFTSATWVLLDAVTGTLYVRRCCERSGVLPELSATSMEFCRLIGAI